LDAARAAKGETDSVPHELKGPDGGDLAVDLAWFGPQSPRRMLITLSGVHGVEGFYGSAVQIEWMRQGEFRRLPEDSAAS
jgi:hypothetical protein